MYGFHDIVLKIQATSCEGESDISDVKGACVVFKAEVEEYVQFNAVPVVVPIVVVIAAILAAIVFKWIKK